MRGVRQFALAPRLSVAAGAPVAAVVTAIALGLAAVALRPIGALAQGGGAAPAATGRATSSVALGVAIVPETVTVGDPFRLVVRVRAPRGSTVEFPVAPDSGTGVEPLDPVVVVPSPDSSVVEQTATYRLAAWDVGALAIRLGEVVVTGAAGEQRIPPGRLRVQVASVLPADSTQRAPRPARALFEFGPPWWWWALVALAGLGVLALLWWLWRRRRAVDAVPYRSPREAAEAEFDRIDALALVASGERGLHVALVVEVVRAYLARVLPGALPSLTTTELVHALRGDGRLPLTRLARLLQDADLVKFAAAPIDASRAEQAGREARALVDAVDQALNPPARREAA